MNVWLHAYVLVQLWPDGTVRSFLIKSSLELDTIHWLAIIAETVNFVATVIEGYGKPQAVC